MKIRKILMATVMVASLIGGLAQADIAFTVDPGATQFAYVNAFNKSDDALATGFAYDPALSTSAFSGSTQILGPNTDIYTANGGGTGTEDAFWFSGDGSGTQLKYLEVNTYQEADSSVGSVITFDFTVLANTLLDNGYTGQGFIKVLDPGAGWATLESDFVNLTTGAKSQSLTIGSGASYLGTPKVQAGFAITGDYVDPTTAATLGTVEVVPEPATFSLLALAGGALALFRRYKNKTSLV